MTSLVIFWLVVWALVVTVLCVYAFRRLAAPPPEVIEPLEGAEDAAKGPAEYWSVRWTSRYGAFSSETRPEMQLFVAETAAEDFAASLRAAFKLLRITSDIDVYVRKN